MRFFPISTTEIFEGKTSAANADSWTALAPPTLDTRYSARAGWGRVGDEKMNKKWQAVRRETPLWEACQLSVAGSLARLPPYGGRRWNAGVRAPGGPDAQPDLDSQLREIPLVGRSKLVRATPTHNNRYKVFSRGGRYLRFLVLIRYQGNTELVPLIPIPIPILITWNAKTVESFCDFCL